MKPFASPYPYKSYSLHNYDKIPQIQRLTREQKEAIEVVGRVLPFKTNSYVINELIDWDNIPEDPIFVLTFPQKAMLVPAHYERIHQLLKKQASKEAIRQAANEIRLKLNPHPAGQLELNVPKIHGEPLHGLQHKYQQTVLFFPSHGQTCHAYCTFCFRWPQFVGMDELKFAAREGALLIEYLKAHKEVTDVLFTGGDPLIMRSKFLSTYIDKLLEANLPHVQNIRIGSKALAYWPYRFLSDPDADELLRLFERVVKSGKHLAIMAHFSHPVELQTDAVQEAIRRIRATGAEIRTQSPILNHINADPQIWATMWRQQVKLGLIPYYMFVVRDTGAQHYFGITLERAWQIFREAYQKTSGLARTVRGPSMSATPGKVQILGVSEINDEKVFVLRFLQGRNPDWVHRPFFAQYNPDAIWLDDLQPAFGEEQFFFEEELQQMHKPSHSTIQFN